MAKTSESVKFDTAEMDMESGKQVIKVTIEGESRMPFWNQDLQLKAVVHLLGSIDYKRFCEENMESEYDELLDEVEEILKELRTP